MGVADQPGASVGSGVGATLSVRFRENGPMVVDLPVGTAFELDGQRRILDRSKLVLCRCGQSAAKPLCDGSHKKMGFEAPAAVVVVPIAE